MTDNEPWVTIDFILCKIMVSVTKPYVTDDIVAILIGSLFIIEFHCKLGFILRKIG